MAYLHKTPLLLRLFYPGLLWKVKSESKILYLTFDDGPIPEATPFVLDVLSRYNIKATFFCVGDNIKKHPDIFQQVIDAGHSIGNHTFNHLNGWKTSTKDYVKNTHKCRQIMSDKGLGNLLFRPPYGKISIAQINALRKKYKIVMWDVLSGDFDPSLTTDKCLKKTINATSDGSIIVFHDNLKSLEKLKVVLPAYIAHFLKKGYKFLPL